MRESLKIKSDDFNIRNNLALTLADCGKNDEAVSLLQETLEMFPNSADVGNKLACMLADAGNFRDAIVYFRRALTASPNDARILCNLGKALYRQGQAAEAVALWRRAVTLQKGEDVWTINQLAWCLATCPDASIRNGKEAVELAALAVTISHERNPAILGTLAAAYAEDGRFADAIETAKKALQRAAKQKDQAPAKSLEAQLAFYEAGKPFRENPATANPKH
jgi:tetratricopeptide (TPR) repeat protein